MKKWLTGLLLICACCLFVYPSGAQAKKITKANLKKEIAQQKKKCRELDRKYSAAKREEKKCKAQYQKKKGEYSAIVFGTPRASSPLIIQSGYILSPLKGWFKVEGGSAGLGGPWIGEVKLTGEYYQWGKYRCRVVKYCKNGSPVYRQYKKAVSNAKKIKKQSDQEDKALAYLKGLPKSKLRLTNQYVSVDEKKKMTFRWNRYQNREKTKWKVSNSKMVKVTKSGSNTVTLKGKKRGTVTLTGIAAISGKKSQCKIKIYDKVKQIVLKSADGKNTYANGDSITVGVGKQLQLQGSCLPSTSLQKLIYSCSDKKIATVSAQGLITAKKVGNTTIKVSDETGRKSQSMTLVVSNDIVSMTPKQKDISVELNDNSGDIRGSSIAKEQRNNYWYMQKLNDANPSGMYILDFSLQMNQQNEPTTDKLTCTSSNSSVVVPMFVYHTSRGSGFPDHKDGYDPLQDPATNLDFGGPWQYEGGMDKDQPLSLPGGRLFIGIIGTGNATITLQSQSGANCSWNIQVRSGNSGQQPDGNTDVQKLKEIIAEQKSLGATMDEDLNSDSYEWNDEGRLIGIYCDDNNLQGKIDFSSFTELESLQCTDNHLSSIDVSGCTALKFFYCENNQLSSLDISGCPALESLGCESNQLSNLDVSACSQLQYLYCTDNLLESLDVSACSELQKLSCDFSVSVIGYWKQDVVKQEEDVAGLNEIIAAQKELGAEVSEDLDSTQYAWNKEGRLTAIEWGSMGLQGEIDFSAFTALNSLQCYDNRITALDVSGCSMLQVLNCTGNNVEGLDVSNCSVLVELLCSENDIPALDVTACPELERLCCDNNEQIASLDVSNCPMLKELSCAYNQIQSLNLDGCQALQELNCSGNYIASLNISNCLELRELYCTDNLIESLDVSRNENLTDLECDDTVTVIG